MQTSPYWKLVGGHQGQMFLPMPFVMFALNALYASPSLLWHLTAAGRGRVWGRWSNTGGFPPCGPAGKRSWEAWGCDRKMQMICAGQWWRYVTWRFMQWRQEEHSALLPPQTLLPEGDFSAVPPLLRNLRGVARGFLRTVLLRFKSNMCGLPPSTGK